MMIVTNVRPFHFPSCLRNPKSPLLFLFLSLPLLMLGQVKPTPAKERMKIVEQKKLMDSQSKLNEIPFRNIGPTIMSGRIVDLDVNPQDPTEFYAAYATGGLWHTTNNGQSFVPIFDQEDVHFIGDIAVNWNSSPDSSKRIIWIGTGEVNSSRSSYAGIGVYKSDNGGKSWEYAGLPESHHIGRILLHPKDPQIAWVAVLGHLYSPNKERGVYKTSDGGKSWKHTLAIDANTGVVDMEINPSNPDVLYAAAWYRTRRAWNFEESGPTGGIFKSTDGGNSWTKITKEGSGFPTGNAVGRIGLTVYEKNPAIVYAIIDNNDRRPDTATKKKDSTKYELQDFRNLSKEKFAGLDAIKLDSFLKKNRYPAKYTAAIVKAMVESGSLKPTAIYDFLANANEEMFNTPVKGCEVYRSEDAGKTWKRTNIKGIEIFSSYGYYFSKIYASPVNDQKIFILGVTAMLSEDGGKTFKTIDKGNVHADHHAFWINPKRDSHIIDGNDGGINISYDNGAHWFKANTPSVGQFYAITVDNAKPYNVYGGLQDNGTWYGPSNHRENIDWHQDGEYGYKSLGGGDGMQVQVDPRDNKTVYSGFQFGFYGRRTIGKEGYKSIRPRHDLGETPLRFNWQTPIQLSSHQPDVLYYGASRFHRSLNQGDSMVAMGDDLTKGAREGDVPFGTITTVSESPMRFGLIYAGTDDGNIQVTKDGGYTWTLVSGKLPQDLYISRVTASKFKEGRVYATLNGYRNDNFTPYLYVSEDYGASWKQLGKDLPYEPVNVVREDPIHENILYVGTDGGVYVTMDSGKSFMSWHRGMPRSVPVHDIAIQERELEIVIGTHGRSLYVSSLKEVHKKL